MYIMLLKVYYSSFSAFTACTFDWLIDGRSLVKTKLNRLINSVCFRVRSITNTVHIVKNDILCLIVLQTLICVIKSTWLAFKICWRRVTRNFCVDNFDLVLLNKLTYSLSSCPLYTSMCYNFYDLNIF